MASSIIWLIDVRPERPLFRIHTRGADAYVPAPVDADGFQHSAVFGRDFRLERRRDARGLWVFDLRSQSQSRDG